jgi:murein L,D-transpeptidase YcbB/YkuD
LRKRLAASGDLSPGLARGEDFDDALDRAVRRFQEHSGLEVDGIVGRNTLAALNRTALERLHQIEVNMERWRWLPRDLGDRFIRVNIASFEVDLFEAGEHLMNMRAVVGKDYRRTPVFSDTMTYLVVNPHWNMPHTIAVEDKLPLIKKDPGYLADNNMELLRGWGAEAVAEDPLSVDWSTVTAENFRWRLRQAPGPDNALGRIKFMFPNKFNVYLHDTPSRALFGSNVRALSSGCIRLEKPVELAEYLLRADPKWTRPALLAAIEEGVEQTVRLPEPIPVHLLYCTTWVDENGTVHFRDDIYGRDRIVEDALKESPPVAGKRNRAASKPGI